jgi:hypothetical protein
MSVLAECQFSDRPGLTHRPFSERTPICWDCFIATVDDLNRAEAEIARTVEALRDLLSTIDLRDNLTIFLDATDDLPDDAMAGIDALLAHRDDVLEALGGTIRRRKVHNLDGTRTREVWWRFPVTETP